MNVFYLPILLIYSPPPTLIQWIKAPLCFRVWNKSALPIGVGTDLKRCLAAHLRLITATGATVTPAEIMMRDAYGNLRSSSVGFCTEIDCLEPGASLLIRLTIKFCDGRTPFYSRAWLSSFLDLGRIENFAVPRTIQV